MSECEPPMMAFAGRDSDATVKGSSETSGQLPHVSPKWQENVVAGSTLLGEVLDTHHPEYPGYIFVRWSDGTGRLAERWLRPVAKVAPRRSDRVLLTMPANAQELIILAVLDSADARPEPFEGNTQADAQPRLRTIGLAADETVRIADAQGRPVCEIEATGRGPVFRLLSQGLDIESAGTLRLAADHIELVAGRGGIDLRTDADAVVRARFIRLN